MSDIDEKHVQVLSEEKNLKNSVILLIILCLTIPVNAVAEIFKCKNSDGNISFQETPCVAGDSKMELHSYIGLATQAPTIKLYSAIPSISTIKPDCTKKSSHNEKLCFCENNKYYMIGKGNSGLQYSMEQLPIHWKKYNNMLQEYKNSPKETQSRLFKRLDLKACEILVVQKRVSSQYDDAIARLENKVKQKDNTKGWLPVHIKNLKNIKELAINIGM